MPTPLPVTLDELLAQRDWVRAFAAALARDVGDADDLAQEAWLTALSVPPRAGTSLRGWLATVMRNRVRDRSRRERVRAERQRETLRLAPRPSASPAERAERAEIERELLRAVHELEVPYREVLLLRYWRGLEPAEIGRLQGAPAATVRSRLHRGLALVRARLDRGPERGTWRSLLATAPGGTTATAASAGPFAAVWLLGLVLTGLGAAAAGLLYRGRAGAHAPRPATLAGRAPAPAARDQAPTLEGARAGLEPASALPGAPPVAPAPGAAEPASPAPAILVRLSGPDGRPVSGAGIFVLPGANPDATPRVRDEQQPTLVSGTSSASSAQSGADGTARVEWPFRRGYARLVARTAELCGVSGAVVWPRDTTVALRLERAVRLAGRVEDAEGAPVAEATVRLEADLGGGLEALGDVRTDAAGTFRFAPLPESLAGSVGGIAASAPGYAEEWLGLDRPAAEREALRLVLRREMVLFGRVVDESGAPVPFVAVEPAPGSGVTSAADGTFRTGPLRPVATRLAILSDRHAALALRVDDPRPGRRDLGDVVLRAGKTLSGTVRLPGGGAAAGVWVGVTDEAVEQVVRQGSTDAQGHFELTSLSDAVLHLAAMAPPDGPEAGAAGAIQGLRAGGGPVELTLSLGCTVRVRALDAATGDALAATFVTVTIRDARAEASEAGQATIFDTRGARQLRVGTRRDGPHLVTVRARGFAEFGPVPVHVDPEREVVVVARLVREGS